MTSFVWLLGGAGVVAMEGSYAPQLLRLHRLKRADEISYFFPGLNLFGRVLALSYSLLTKDSVFIVGFLVGCALRLALLLQVYWYRHGGRRPDMVVHTVVDAEAKPDAGAVPALGELAKGALR